MAHARKSDKPVFMLVTLVFLFAAAVVCVSVSRRLKFGSILGYLVAVSRSVPSHFGS